MPRFTFPLVTVLSILFHGAFLIYGSIQDRHPVVKFTDVDYLVFTDGARYVSSGASPYLRATYRYTPLLAWLVGPNVTVHPLWGKVLFCVCDVLTGWFIYAVLCLRGMEGGRAAKYAAVWMLNPFVVAISTRGNAESVVSVLVMATLWALVAKKQLVAAVLFGTSVHFKIFPIVYALPFWLLLRPEQLVSNDSRTDATGVRRKSFRDAIRKTKSSSALTTATLWTSFCEFFNRARLQFGLLSGAVFLGLTGAMYYLYGTDFLHETYLYHITRKDHRHNFSLYFYHMYLSSASAPSPMSSLLSFLPQFGLVTVLGAVLAKDVVFACFAQTFAFVMLNKVCTSQYFMWYLCFLPIILPSSRFTNDRKKGGLILLSLWVGAQALWLSQAYALEHLGQNTFRELWVAGAVFYIVNAAVLAKFVEYHRFEEVFDKVGCVRDVFGDAAGQRDVSGRRRRSVSEISNEECTGDEPSPPTPPFPKLKQHQHQHPELCDSPPTPKPRLILSEQTLGPGILRFTVSRAPPLSRTNLAADVLAALCTIVPVVHYFSTAPPSLPILTFGPLLIPLIHIPLRLRAVHSESVTFIRNLGLALHTNTTQTRFIPLTNVAGLVINEAITRLTVKYYLAVVVRDQEELVVVFENSMPRLDMLKRIRADGERLLWGAG
ncbi:PIG-M-domain-containing protein [Powellomyces hirtus]|nr:PIG-M-domain-containing protein [Powellomyces hirtus]